MKKIILLIFMVLLSVPILAQDCATGTLYSVAQGDAELRIIDPADGSTMSSITMTLAGESINGANGLATHPSTGDLWAILRIAGGGFTGRALVTVNATTGVTTLIGDTQESFAGLAFDTAGTLYGVSGDGSTTPETLFTLDTNTGLPTLECTLGNGNDGETIGFNPNDGLIYHASGHTGANVIFETVDGACTITNIDITGTALEDEEAQALTWNAVSGEFLWKQDHGTGPLFSVTTTGVPTLLGPMDHQAKGLAFCGAWGSSQTVCGVGNPQPIPVAGTGGFPCVGGPTTSAATTTGIAGVVGSNPGEYTIESVSLDITHTWDSDLEIDLVSPDGTIWDLSSDNGGAGDNYTGTVFMDGNPSITTGAPPFTGTFEAEQGPMNPAFAGDNAIGPWTLSICDDAGGDSGTLNSYCITISRNPVVPLINCPMPDPLIVSADPGVCTAQVAFADAVAIDPDGGTVVVTQTMGPPSGSDFPLGDTIIEFTATDEQGDQSTCQFTITVEDNEPPSLTCAPAVTQTNDPGVCEAFVTVPPPTPMDNCSTATAATVVGPNTVYVDDGGGNLADTPSTVSGLSNSAGGDVTIVVDYDGDWGSTVEDFDLHGPDGTTIFFRDNQIGDCSGYQDTFTVAEATWNNWITTYGTSLTFELQADSSVQFFCAANFYQLSITLGMGATLVNDYNGTDDASDIYPVGTTTVTWTFTDIGGNTAQCTQDVTVTDDEAPVVTCIGQPGMATDSESTAPGTPISDTLPPTVSTLTVTDDVTIDDLNVDLNISHTWVSDMTITLESPMGTVVTIFDGPADGCSGDDIIDIYDDESANILNGNCMGGTPDAFPLADYQPSNPLSAFDGEQTLGDWILTITDGVGGDDGTLNSWGIIWEYADPGTPYDVILDANGMATIPATDLIVSATDNCGAVVVTAGGGGGMTNTLFTTLAGGNGNFGNMFDINALEDATIQSFDIHGDTGAVFDVEVYAKVGTWVGSEDVPGDWTLIGTAPGVVSNGDGVATPLNLNLGYAMNSGETHAFYVTPTDFSTGGFNYTNGTATGNVFASDTNIEFLEGAGKGYPFTGTTFQPRVFNGNIIYSTGGGLTIDFTCDDLGINFVEIVATDAAGNESMCTATVNVIDNTPPVLVCMDVTIEIGPNGTTDIEPEDLLASSPTTYDVISISSDNQSGTEGFTDFTVPVTAADVVSFDWDYTTPDGAAFDGFGYLLNGVFTELTDPAGPNDQSGNSGPIAVAPGDVFGFRSQSDDGIFGAATTTISGFVPGFSGQFDPANWTLTLTNSDGDAFFVEIPGGPLSFDACGITVMAVSVNEVTCDDIANSPLTVTVFASDASGNLAACQSMVTVVDLLGPEVTCPADMTVDPGPGNLFYTVPDYWAQGDATAVDNCTDPLTIFSQDPAAGSQISDGVYTVSICSTDEYGNQGCCTFELTVESILGADDNALNQAISMYPNPAQEYVTIANGSSILLDNAMIYDVNGKLVNQIDLRNMGSEKVIDVSNLASGVYMVQITSERSSVIKRLLKE